MLLEYKGRSPIQYCMVIPPSTSLDIHLWTLPRPQVHTMTSTHQLRNAPKTHVMHASSRTWNTHSPWQALGLCTVNQPQASRLGDALPNFSSTSSLQASLSWYFIGISSGIAGNPQTSDSCESEAPAVPLPTDEMGLKIAEFQAPSYSGGGSHSVSISISNFTIQ